MRPAALLTVAAGFAALVACQGTHEAPAATEPAHHAVAPEWPDATSQWGDWTLRLRHLPGSVAVTDAGRCIVLSAELVTDDPDVLFAGGPRASVVRSSRDAAVDAALLDEDAWSGRTWESGRRAFVHLPAEGHAGGPVDIEVRCRLMKVAEWTTHDLGQLGVGEHAPVDAHPYELSVHALADEVIVSATSERDLPRKAAAAGRLEHLLPHGWAAGAVEVRDAHGTRLESSGTAGTHWGSTVGFVLGPAESRLPVAYPITVRLRVPRRVELVYPLFEWQGLDLPALPDRPPAETVEALDLPPGYRDAETAKRECAAALAATDPTDSPWQRVADVLLRAPLHPLREELRSRAAEDDTSAQAMLAAIDGWRIDEESRFDDVLRACRASKDIPRLVVGLRNPMTEVDAARIADTIADVDPHAALPWLRLERALARTAVSGGMESRIVRDDLIRSLDRALDAASRPR